MKLIFQILESLFDFPYLLQTSMPKQKYIVLPPILSAAASVRVGITRLYYQNNSGNPISIALTT